MKENGLLFFFVVVVDGFARINVFSEWTQLELKAFRTDFYSTNEHSPCDTPGEIVHVQCQC